MFCGAFHLGWELLNGRWHNNANVRTNIKKDVQNVVIFCPTSNSFHFTRSGLLIIRMSAFTFENSARLFAGSLYSLLSRRFPICSIQMFSFILSFFLSRKRKSFPETSNCVTFLKNEFIWTGIRLPFSLSTDLLTSGNCVVKQFNHNLSVWMTRPSLGPLCRWVGRLTNQTRSLQVCNSRSQISYV